MSAELRSSSPTEVLAQQVADAFCSANLIPAAKQVELLAKLQLGHISAQDWRVLLELGLPRSKGNDRNAVSR